jgi:hypothetical protein
MIRRDAHWAPFATADMMLLSTWTPLGRRTKALRAWRSTTRVVNRELGDPLERGDLGDGGRQGLNGGERTPEDSLRR